MIIEGDKNMDFILDALLDSLKILPFLLICYVLIEVVEFFTAKKIEPSRLLSGKWSTLFASSFGLIPQCGFSVVATDLFASKKIKIGTLIAVYIATSDEAVPILLTNPDKISSLLPLLLIKFCLAVIFGYLIDLIFQKANKKRLGLNENNHHDHDKEESKSLACEKLEITENHKATDKNQIDQTSEENKVESVQQISVEEKTEEHVHDHHEESSHHHGCCGHEIEGTQTKKDLWKRFALHPLVHSLKIFAFILVVNLIMGGIVALVGEDKLVSFLISSKVFAPLFACIVGLIPNCASSVVLTELFTIGGISFGACIGGLIVNAGIAFVVLFKENKNMKENFSILGAMFAIGVTVGYVIQLIGF